MFKGTREQRGWYFFDWAVSAYSTTVGAVFLGPYLTSIAEAAAKDYGVRRTRRARTGLTRRCRGDCRWPERGG